MSTIDQFRTDFGDELTDDIREIIRSETAGLQNQVADNALQTRRNRVMAAMDADRTLGAIWRAVNAEDGFINWLKQPDPFFGEARQRPLQQAFDRGEAERVRAIFASYLVEQKRLEPSAATPRTTPEPWMNLPPSTAGRTPAGQRQRQWTRAQIAAVYEAFRRCEYDKRPEERRRLEQEIIAASQRPGGIADPPLDPDAIMTTQPRPPAKARFRYRVSA
jgi:hypothetical protein